MQNNFQITLSRTTLRTCRKNLNAGDKTSDSNGLANAMNNADALLSVNSVTVLLSFLNECYTFCEFQKLEERFVRMKFR